MLSIIARSASRNASASRTRRSSCRNERVFATLAMLAIFAGLPGSALSAPSKAQLRGRVLDLFGSPIPGAKVSISSGPSEGEAIARTTESDNDGVYTFRGVSPGSYSLVATLDGFRPFRHTLQLHAAETKWFDIGLVLFTWGHEAPCAIHGTVVLPDNETDDLHQSIVVTARAAFNPTISHSIVADGDQFRLEVPESGQFVVFAHRGGSRIVTHDVWCTSGASIQIELRAERTEPLVGGLSINPPLGLDPSNRLDSPSSFHDEPVRP